MWDAGVKVSHVIPFGEQSRLLASHQKPRPWKLPISPENSWELPIRLQRLILGEASCLRLSARRLELFAALLPSQAMLTFLPNPARHPPVEVSPQDKPAATQRDQGRQPPGPGSFPVNGGPELLGPKG